LKSTKLLFVLAVFFAAAVLLVSSCNTSGSDDDIAGYSEYKNFVAQTMTDNKYYLVYSQLVYKGEKCDIWRQNGIKISADTVYALADTFDNKIYNNMINAFSSGEPFEVEDPDNGENQIVASNPMEWADYLGNGDGKLTILLLDIKDGYKKAGDPYVAGYFTPVNLYSKQTYGGSNECDMIYIDTNPGLNYIDTVYGTLAHEMQHMMNFAISAYKRLNSVNNGIGAVDQMDTWIDEGLSVSSEWIWNGQQAYNRINWYLNDQTKYIAYGNNFFVWDNYRDYYASTVLDDYATDYLFFQWLRLQSGGADDIYKEIINSQYSDYHAVTEAADTAVPGYNYNIWGNLLGNWLAANYINAADGAYGYCDDPDLNCVSPKYSLLGTGKFPLAPGEGIYTKKQSMPAETDNIEYASLSRKTDEVSYTQILADHDMLLSYNTDINNDPDNYSDTDCDPFDANTAPSIQQAAVSMSSLNEISQNNISRQQQQTPVINSYPISASDMLRRNGYPDSFLVTDSRDINGTADDE